MIDDSTFACSRRGRKDDKLGFRHIKT